MYVSEKQIAFSHSWLWVGYGLQDEEEVLKDSYIGVWSVNARLIL